MSQEMVKKSVDITEEDNQWLEEHSYINFSKFCRRKLAERRAESVRGHVKEKLHNEIKQMAEKGSELRDELKEEREKLKDKYNAEFVEKCPEYFVFEIDGESFGGHWKPHNPFEDQPDEPSEEAREFGEKFVDSWFDKVDRFGEFVNEETSFDVADGDAYQQDLEGHGYLRDFTLHTKYVPYKETHFTIKFASRVDINIEDLKESSEYTSKTCEGENQ